MNDNMIWTTTAPMTLHTPAAGNGQPFATKVVRTIDGYCGQVLVHGDIVWQGKPRKGDLKATRDAKRHLAQRLAAVFA